MSEIDHDAARDCANEAVEFYANNLLANGYRLSNSEQRDYLVSTAYLDLHAQLATERARVARIRQAFTAWVESPHYVFDTQGAETAEWLALNQAIYDNAHAQGDEE